MNPHPHPHPHNNYASSFGESKAREEQVVTWGTHDHTPKNAS